MFQTTSQEWSAGPRPRSDHKTSGATKNGPPRNDATSGRVLSNTIYGSSVRKRGFIADLW